jgi:NADPH:quinone reductase-like Zn-dependent oxidoreductase
LPQNLTQGWTTKAIVVTDEAAGTARMKLVERPEPHAAINDVVVRIHASGFVPTELAWPSTCTDRLDRDRTPLSSPIVDSCEVVQRVRDGRLRTNIGNIATLDDAVAALNPAERGKGKTIIRVRP